MSGIIGHQAFDGLDINKLLGATTVPSVSANTLTVSSNATIGSSTSTLTINAGTVTTPNVPAFLAISSVTQTNVTGNSTAITVAFGNVDYNRASGFSTATNTFTAPVAGIYNFWGAVSYTGLTSNHTTVQTNVVVNSTIVYTPALQTYSTSAGITALTQSWDVVVSLSSGGTVLVQGQVSASSSGADIVGGSSLSPQTWFAGQLVG